MPAATSAYRTLMERQIELLELRPSDRVPSENELVETMSVSRMTANRALRELNDEGYVDRIAISSNARRLGLATLMYRDFEASLPASTRVMTCEVNLLPPNESSMRFHEGFGFHTVGTQTLDSGRKTVALMAKDRDS